MQTVMLHFQSEEARERAIGLLGQNVERHCFQQTYLRLSLAQLPEFIKAMEADGFQTMLRMEVL